jgi:hypothetical protein
VLLLSGRRRLNACIHLEVISFAIATLQETSTVILISASVGLMIEIWKLRKAARVSVRCPPFVSSDHFFSQKFRKFSFLTFSLSLQQKARLGQAHLWAAATREFSRAAREPASNKRA